MRFLHLSDIHIGKKLNGFSLLEDQKHILNETLEIVKNYEADAVIIAGDIYDSPIPPTDAVMLLDDFLTKLLELNKLIFIISGNHDSPWRLAFCKNILRPAGLYISALFNGTIDIHPLKDEYGPINIYMLPFVKPSNVKPHFDGASIDSYNDAVKAVIDNTHVNHSERNILIAHQFVTKSGSAPLLSDSETRSVGGLDNIDCSVFNGFDYVALGHLHSPQSVEQNVVYGGSPLKYSVSERHQKKCCVLIDIKEKGDILIDKIPLTPLRDVRQIKGPFEALMSQEKSNDYISVILTDKTRHLEPYKRLRTIYSNCISVAYEEDEALGNKVFDDITAGDLKNKSVPEIFDDFYFEQNNETPSEFCKSYILKAVSAFSGEGE